MANLLSRQNIVKLIIDSMNVFHKNNSIYNLMDWALEIKMSDYKMRLYVSVLCAHQELVFLGMTGSSLASISYE